MSKCLAKDRNNTICRNYSIKLEDGTNSRFCNNHQYMNDYTNEQLNNTRLCSNCKKHYYFPNLKIKQCSKCKERSRINREKKKENEIKVLCSKDGCKYKHSIENKYCNLHQRQLFEDEVKSENMKCCYNVIRGCRNKLELTYNYSKCPECLEKDREKDNKRREIKLELNIENKNICIECGKEHKMESFINHKNNKIFKSCEICRNKQKLQDNKRDKTHVRNLAKINEKKIERYIKKSQERLIDFKLSESTYNTLIKSNCYYCNDFDIINGIDRKDCLQGYFENNCVPSCKICNFIKGKLSVDDFRKKIKNILIFNKKIIGNLDYKYKFTSDSKNITYARYRISANKRNYQFKLSNEEFQEIISNSCYLCGISKKNSSIGIDRFDNNIGYIYSNCRSCCTSCNFMKKEYSFDELITKLVNIYNFFIKNN